MRLLHLGVVDIPYVSGPLAPRRQYTRRHPDGTITSHTAPAAGQQTTGDVANYLEAKYHVMEVFANARRRFIARALAESYRGAIENVIMGGPATMQPFADATSAMEANFKKFLSSGEIEGMGIPGVPTKAALMGKSKRFKKGKNPKGRRPSFIDTGLYQSSFKAWIDASD